MKLSHLTILPLLAAILSSGAALANEDINVKPFFGDFHGNGLETAVPLLTETDANQDGYPESITIRYKVYTAGTTTFVSATTPKTFPTPSLPVGCTPNGTLPFDADDIIGFHRRQGGLDSSGTLVPASKRIHTALVFELDCWNGMSNQEKSMLFIYSADMSNATPVWTKFFYDVDLLGLNGVDADGDLVNDHLAIMIDKEVPAGANVLVFLVNGQTGVSNLPPKWYAIGR